MTANGDIGPQENAGFGMEITRIDERYKLDGLNVDVVKGVEKKKGKKKKKRKKKKKKGKKKKKKGKKKKSGRRVSDRDLNC